jgi:hypothetical protein
MSATADREVVTTGGAWHPDPARRYLHRWWTGEWTTQVSNGGDVVEDPVPWNQPAADQSIFCADCDAAQARHATHCWRCSADLSGNSFFDRRRRTRLSNERFVEEVRTSLGEALTRYDTAIRRRQTVDAIRALDDVATDGWKLLRVLPHVSDTKGSAGMGFLAAALTGGLGIEDLIIGPLAAALTIGVRRRQKQKAMQDVEETILRARIRAIELLPEVFAASDALSANLLARFAPLYLPGEPLPSDPETMERWIATRVEWIEEQLPELNGFILDYARVFSWQLIQAALESIGYQAADRRSSDAPPPRSTGRMSPDEAASLLGIAVTSTRDEIKRAYRSEAAKYHPDKLTDVAPEIRELAEARMRLINEAYEVLLDQMRQSHSGSGQ